MTRTKIVRQYRYGAFRGMDLFFSGSTKTYGKLIRLACLWSKGARYAWRNRKRKDIPHHGGIIRDDHGQMLIAESGPKGNAYDNTFDYYRTNKAWLTDVFRWSGFDDPVLREKGEAFLARRCRKGKEKTRYDWISAAFSSALGRAVLGRVFKKRYAKYSAEQDAYTSRDFCTEMQREVLEHCGCTGLPANANPIAMRDAMAKRPDFSRVTGYLAT